MKVPVTLTAAMLFCSVAALADEVEKKSLQESFDRAEKVARIKVVKAELVVRDEHDCGADYGAAIITSFKGGEAPFEFRSTANLVVGGEYLVFASLESLDAERRFLANGDSDVNGFAACTEEGALYASRRHGEVLEFDLLWQAATGKAVVKATVPHTYLATLDAQKVELDSDGASDLYLALLSYWRIGWSSFEAALNGLSE